MLALVMIPNPFITKFQVPLFLGHPGSGYDYSAKVEVYTLSSNSWREIIITEICFISSEFWMLVLQWSLLLDGMG